MAFDNSNVLSANTKEQEEKRRERMAAMFGRTTSGVAAAVFPKGERVNLPIDLIDKNPDNASIFSLENIDELSGNMDDVGFMGAVLVFEKPDGRYELYSGHRRWLARKQQGLPDIPAIIEPMPDEILKAKKLLSSNIQQRELTPYELAKAIDYYRNHVLRPSGFEGDTIDACAEYFMKSRANIKRLIAINKVIPELQELTKNPSFPFTSLEKVTGFTEEEQKELYREIIDYQKANPELEISHNYILQSVNFIKSKRDRIQKKEADESIATKKPILDTPVKTEHESSAIPELNKEPLANKSHLIPNVSVTPKTPKKPPLLPLIKTYSIRLKEIDLKEYRIESAEDIIREIEKMEASLKTLRENIASLDTK